MLKIEKRVKRQSSFMSRHEKHPTDAGGSPGTGGAAVAVLGRAMRLRLLQACSTERKT